MHTLDKSFPAENGEHDSQRFPAQPGSSRRLLPGSFTFHNRPIQSCLPQCLQNILYFGVSL
jgi:hypothetical protein